jgi:hypothetical protein
MKREQNSRFHAHNGLKWNSGADFVHGVLKVTPLTSAVPEEAEALIRRAYALLPHVKITDLLLELDRRFSVWSMRIICGLRESQWWKDDAFLSRTEKERYRCRYCERSKPDIRNLPRAPFDRC